MNTIPLRVISLRSSLARRQAVEQQLAGAGERFAWSYIDAVDGRALDAEARRQYDRRTRMLRNGFDMSDGEIGCFLSHRLAWRECLALNQPMLILEDDFRLLRQPAEWLPPALQWLASCELLRLHGIYERKERTVAAAGSDRCAKLYVDPSGLTAYLLRPQAAAALLARSASFYMPVDDFVGETWLHRQRIRYFLPYPFGITGAQSEIDIQVRSKPRLNPLRVGLRELYRMRSGWLAGIFRFWSFYFEK